ncbi:putative ribosomal protein S21e [Rosa chinensis]|uniref:Putative ribosomal protein S21e n=1 Tax=Rosa chinensis TaxID=74649 RepID=A0A2P6QYG2_ROSCH|nr:putative ribosomal protein S21e [Rosa chinensis]
MQNKEGQITELYIPRKYSATNSLITSKDHASVRINIGHLDENGIYTGQFSTFALCELWLRPCSDYWIIIFSLVFWYIDIGSFSLLKAMYADSGLDRLWQKKKAEVKQQ